MEHSPKDVINQYARDDQRNQEPEDGPGAKIFAFEAAAVIGLPVFSHGLLPRIPEIPVRACRKPAPAAAISGYGRTAPARIRRWRWGQPNPANGSKDICGSSVRCTRTGRQTA